MTRFVCCGEALIDLVRLPDESGGTLSSTWVALSAGSIMNTAIALARLGEPVEFLGRLGGDKFGSQIRSHLLASGVGLSLAVSSDQATSLAVVSLDEAGKASYNFHFADTANFGWQPEEFPALTADDWLHVGSLGLIVQPSVQALLDFASTFKGDLSIDLNVRPTVQPDAEIYWQTVDRWLRVVGTAGGVIKASDDDITFLAKGSGASGDPLTIAADWAREYSAAMVVVTMGAEGAVAVFEDGSRIPAPGRKVTVVDTVGAGDTFMAGFLEAYAADPLNVTAALNRGVAASAIVCGRRGANPPTSAEVDALLAAD